MKSFPLAVLAPIAVAAAFVLGAGPGCSTSCDDAVEGEAEEVHSGITDASGGVYESSPWEGEYLEFLPQKRLKFFHGLRGRPRSVQTYVAFVRAPLQNTDTGNVSEVAGNIAIIEGIRPDFVQIRNDTCETFFVRLVASNPVDDPGNDGSAGTSNP